MSLLAERTDDQFKVASMLTPLELRSAVRRRQYAGDISLEDAELAISTIEGEMRRMILHPVSSTVLELAAALVDRQNLRALDSVQLSTALLAGQSARGYRLQFIASDLKLLSAARAEGLDVWNPEVQ